MRVTEKMKKVIGSLLALSMVLSYVPVPAMAEEVCPHHVHNTEVCGFVEGADCTHEHGEGCGDVTVTRCVHVHGQDGCTYVPGTPAVFCHPTHTEECGYDAGSGCQCDLSEGKAHLEGCGFVEAAPCTVTHEGCVCAAEVPATGECNHGECTAETGCVTTRFVCAHTAHEGCGYVEAKPCTYDPATCAECAESEHTHVYDGAPVYAKKDAFVHTVTRACTTCEEQPTVAVDEVHSYTDGLCVCGEAEPVKCTCESTDPGEHAPFCALYVRTYEECKCVLDCAEEGLNDGCETCYFEGVEACTGGEEEASAYLTEGTDYTITNGKLVIHDSVTTIDDYAFYYKSNITSVVIPASVTTIGDYAFHYCYKLTAVTIAGNSSLTIGDYAFHGCSSLSSVTYQSTSAPASIGDKAFPTTVKSVTVPYGFTANSFGGLSLNIVGGGPVAVASVTLKRDGNDAGSRVSMTCKAPMQLTADISPANADNKKVTWTQAEQNGAKPFLTIANDGTITATFAGYTAADFEPFVYGYYSDVTVTTEDGSKTDTVTVEVNRYTLVIKDGKTEKFRLPRPAGYALSGLIPAEYTTPSKPGYIFKGWKRAYEKAGDTMGYDSLITSLPATMPHTSASNAAHEQIYVEQWEVDPDVTFAVNVSNTTGGMVTANHSAAAAETVITLTVNVSNGYELEGFTDGTNAITTTKVDDTTYTFVMPNRDVTVTPVYKSLHQHQWAYSVNAAKDTITAACTAENCPNTDGGSVTISASDATYDGNPKPAALSAASIGGIDNLSVAYEGLSSAPVNAGTYTAKLTVGEKEVSVTYTIAPKAVRITGVTAVSRAYEAGRKTVAVTAVTTDDTGVTVTVPADYTGTLASDAVGSYSAITLDLSGLILSSSNHCFTGSGENLVTDVSITGTVSEADVTGLEDSYAYTGAAIQPEPVVTANGVTLVKDTDYTVAYGENINAAAGGTVTVTGKGLYSGTVRKTFTITALEIKDEHVVLTPADAVYDGNVKSAVITVVMDGKTVDPQNYEVTGLDAISSAVGKYPVTVTGKGNYTGTVTKNFEITVKQLSEDSVTLTADLTYNAQTQKPTVTVKNGDVTLTADTDYAVSYEKVIAGAAAVPVTGAPKDAGSYNAVITGKGNYSGVVRKPFAIKPNTGISVTPETLTAVTYTGNAIAPTVTVKGVNDAVLVRNRDYTVTLENNTNAGTAKVTVAGIGNYAGAKKELTFTILAKELTEANVTVGETVLVYKAGQKNVPEITVKDGTKTLKEGTDYVISCFDKDSAKVEEPIAVGSYTVKVIGVASVSEDGSGNYSGTVTKTFVITDDTTNPVITGVTNGKTYYTTQKATVKDDNLVSVTKNGTSVIPVVSAGTDVTLAGNASVTYTVAAADIAKHTVSVTVIMKPISTLDDTIENLTVANVKLTDKTAVQAVLDKVNPIRTGECANATQAEKDALDAIVKKANDLMKVITDVEDTIAKISAMPDSRTTQPDHENAVKTYEAARKAYDALSDHGRELVGTANKAKLDAMYKALTDYDIIKGHKSSYTRYSGKTFSITANGYYGKFTGLKVDGKLVDAKYYTAKSGSTIVTFDNVYLDSLTDGKHTVEFLYTDGSTGTNNYFRVGTSNGTPSTGDNAPVVIFSGIMMTSLLGMALLLLNRKKFLGK